MRLTKTEVDRLGERLKADDVGEADLRSLDEYRWSFGDALDSIVERIERAVQLTPTQRRAKTTQSIRLKLGRESIRLSQMQDIAGCRLVVPDEVQQDSVVQLLQHLFPDATVVDRRERPRYGYRAVHLIVRQSGKRVEIQVRSFLQDKWAALAEKFSEREPDIKYGGGNQETLRGLETLSRRDRKSTRLNSSHSAKSRMPSSA